MSYYLVRQSNKSHERMTTLSELLHEVVKGIGLFTNKDLWLKLYGDQIKDQGDVEENGVEVSPDEFKDFEQLMNDIDGLGGPVTLNLGEWV